MNNYKEKYFKYKKKYFLLKNQIKNNFKFTQIGGEKTFKIYTSGMNELYETWNSFLRERIIFMIPEEFDRIEIKHYDCFDETGYQTRPSQEKIMLLNGSLYEGDLSNPRVKSSEFLPTELPFEELKILEATETNHYIYLDFAHLLDYPRRKHLVEIKGSYENTPLSAIYFGWCGEYRESPDGSTNFDNALNLPFFYFEDGVLVTYIDHMIKLKYEYNLEYPGAIFNKIIDDFKKEIIQDYRAKYAEQFKLEDKNIADEFDKLTNSLYKQIYEYLLQLIFTNNIKQTDVIQKLKERFAQQILDM